MNAHSLDSVRSIAVVWDTEKLDRVVSLWDTGRSVSQIGDILGVSMESIKSLIRRHRDRFERRQVKGEAKTDRERRKRANAKKSAARRIPDLSIARIVAEPVTLLKLTSGACKWPIAGEGASMLFCGDVAPGSAPYCRAHGQLAYQPWARSKPGT